MRRGITLVELLVVIFIIISITALAIPIVAPAMRGRQVREASRLVTAYFAGARAEAIRSGRATGVMIERFDGSPEFSMQLSRCQVPQLFAGNRMDGLLFPTANPNECTLIDPATGNPHDSWKGRVAIGDSIKFNYQGRVYQIIDATDADGDSDDDTFTFVSSDPTAPPVTLPPSGLPYQVFRQPRRTSHGALRLPDGIVIDLNYSGDEQGPLLARDKSAGGFTGTPYENDPHVGTTNSSLEPVVIMFAPNGLVEKVHRPDATGVRVVATPISPLHLLIGRRERVPVTAVQTAAQLASIEQDSSTDQRVREDLAEEQLATFNFMDLECLWVTVNPRSGLVSSSEMAAVLPIDDPSAPPTSIGPIADRVRASRAIAVEGASMGGN